MISGRSMNEPISESIINSLIDQVYPSSPFSETPFKVRAVLPERTFLEKVFLLHEEFFKPSEQIRVKRMSRHMYDLVQMMKTPIANNALGDEALYRDIVEHRRAFIGLRGFDYNSLYPGFLNIIPPEAVIKDWENDYNEMCESMIYGETPSFVQLVEHLSVLNKVLNDLSWTPNSERQKMSVSLKKKNIKH